MTTNDDDERGRAAVADQLRRSSRAARRELDGPGRASAQRRIAEQLSALDELADCTDVGWYLPTDGEVDLDPALEPLRSRGVRLWLPVVGDERTMEFAAWLPGADLLPNRFGIDEPGPEAERRTAAELGAVVVPCVAVDAVGHRLGFGAGYYDRALADSAAVRIGVAFEVQVVDRIEPAPWDVPLDLVITEAGVLRP